MSTRLLSPSVPSPPCPLSLADACAPSVCRLFCLVAMRRVVFSFLVSCWCCRVLCVVFLVVGVRGGFFVLFRHCLLNVCVPRRQVPLQHAPPLGRSFLCPVLLSCCLSSVCPFSCVGRFLVGVRARLACLVVYACACVLVRFGVVRFKLVLPPDSTFGLKPLFGRPPSFSLPPFGLMAEAPAVRRRRGRGEDGEQHRAVRARVDDAETRLDSLDLAALQRHETRIQFVEAPFRLVLRGFQCVPEFLRLLRSNDLRAAKTAFIPSFVDELKEQSGPEVAHLIEECENLLVDRQGWVLLGVFPTGGHFNDVPDGLLRLQPGYAGSRLSHLLAQASRYLADTHQVFQDRVRRPQPGGKGGDKGKGKGKQVGGKGKAGKGKAKGPQPKMAAAPTGWSSRVVISAVLCPEGSWPYPFLFFDSDFCFCYFDLGFAT